MERRAEEGLWVGMVWLWVVVDLVRRDVGMGWLGGGWFLGLLLLAMVVDG